MPVVYSIEGNNVFREGELVAQINADKMIDFANDEIASRYSGVISKFLADENRYNRETGEAVYLVPDCDSPEEETVEPEKEVPVEENQRTPELRNNEPIDSIAALIEHMQVHIEEPCPPFDPYFGEESPDVLRWINAHGDIVRRIKQCNHFTGALAARKDI